MTGFANRFRTNEEILEHINLIKGSDPFMITTNDLILCMDLEAASVVLGNVALDPEEWYSQPVDPKGMIEGYMPFALAKAFDHRGLSALRSISHFKAYTWLDGKDELYEFLCDDKNYYPYGVPMLKKVCNAYGIPWTEDTQMNRMADGTSCTWDCKEGCL